MPCPEAFIDRILSTSDRSLSPAFRLDLSMDSSMWAQCPEEKVMEMCARTGDDVNSRTCTAVGATRTLILLWASFAVFLFIEICVYNGVRYFSMKATQRDPPDPAFKAETKLTAVLKWSPLGLQLKALFSLAVYWFDVGTDIRVIVDVWMAGGWTGYALLGVLVEQFVFFGVLFLYIATHGLIRTHGQCWRCLGYCFFVLVCVPFGTVLLVTFDMLLIVASLGSNLLSSIKRKLDFSEYQLFRDIGRSLFGSIPTLVLQSIVFARGATPQNALVITRGIFLASFMATGLQLIKTISIFMYISAQKNSNMFVEMWNAFWGKKVMLTDKKSDAVNETDLLSAL